MAKVTVPTVKKVTRSLGKNLLVGSGAGIINGLGVALFGAGIGQVIAGVINGAVFSGEEGRILALNSIQDGMTVLMLGGQ
jgi:hypothetical protein